MDSVTVGAASRTVIVALPVVVGAVVASALAGCSARPCRDTTNGDCVSLFAFEDRTYFRAPTQVVESVPVGREIGTGTMDPCPGEDPACVEPTDIPVFAFPGAPPKQAIVLTNTAGDGFAYIVTARPAEGWDAGLTGYLERAGVRTPSAARHPAGDPPTRNSPMTLSPSDS